MIHARQFSHWFYVLVFLLALPAANANVSGEATSKVLIFGDSLSAAHNISIQQSWPVLLQRKLEGHPLQVINASISGETTHGGLQRLPSLLKQHQPQFLVLELGGNDGLQGQSFSSAQKNLSKMINLAFADGIQVLLIGVRLPPNYGPIYTQKFQEMYRDLADEFQLAFIPKFLEGIAASEPELMQRDGIHPTEKAQPMLADKVYRALLPLLKAE